MKPRRPFVLAADRCIDCFRPSKHTLCDACIAKLQATPVPGERLPWEQGYDAILADLKDHAIFSIDEALALATLYAEADDRTRPEHTAAVLGETMKHLTVLLGKSVEYVLENSERPSAVAFITREVVDRARLIKRVGTLLLRGATYEARNDGGDIERRWRGAKK